MQRSIRVAILENHQSTIDGYTYRLSMVPEIEIVAAFLCEADLAAQFNDLKVDVFISGIDLPVSAKNRNPFSILKLIDRINKQIPDTKILIISYINQQQIIDSLLKKGVNGFVLKEDQQSIQKLGRIVEIIASGGVFFSKELQQEIFSRPSTFKLTERQLEALMLCAAYPDEDTFTLAKEMNISSSTLRNLLSAIYLKLEVRTRAAAIIKARQLQLIPPASQTDAYPTDFLNRQEAPNEFDSNSI
jgi:DNA-binding NarL/FixJ family response regulator